MSMKVPAARTSAIRPGVNAGQESFQERDRLWIVPENVTET